MKSVIVHLVEKALIIGLVAALSFTIQSAAALGPYGPVVGSVATVVLAVVNKLLGSPVAQVAAKLSPRPF